MNKILLLLITLSIFSINAAQEKIEGFEQYPNLPLNMKMEVFKHYIADAYSIDMLNNEVQEFIAKTHDDKRIGNQKLVHETPDFAKVVNDKKKDILERVIPALESAQKRFDKEQSFLGHYGPSERYDLIKDGPNAKNYLDFPAIIYAVARTGDIKLVKDLLDAGASPNARGPYAGNTPLTSLFSLTVSGPFDELDLPIIKLLIERGADINLPDYEGWTPLDQAYLSDNQKSECTKYLEQLGAKTNYYYKDEQGRIRRKPLQKRRMESSKNY